MSEIVVAIIAFVGLGFGAFVTNYYADRFRRKDLREALIRDLEIYEKLPDGVGKKLMEYQIETNVKTLFTSQFDQAERGSQTVRFGTTLVVGIFVLVLNGVALGVSGLVKFARLPNGVLQLVVVGDTEDKFYDFIPSITAIVLFCAVYIVCSYFIAIALTRAQRAAAKLLAKSKKAPSESSQPLAADKAETPRSTEPPPAEPRAAEPEPGPTDA